MISVSTLTLLPHARETIATLTIDTRSLHRILRAVMPHRNTNTYNWLHSASQHIQVEVAATSHGRGLLTVAARDGYTIAAATAAFEDLDGADTWTGMIDGDRAAELLHELRGTAVHNLIATITINADGVTIVLPEPAPRLKSRWRTIWHLLAVDAEPTDWRTKIERAFEQLADATPTEWPAAIGTWQAQKWLQLGEEPVMLCAGPGKPIIVYADGAIGLGSPLRFGENETRDGVIASYRDNAWWAMPNGGKAVSS